MDELDEKTSTPVSRREFVGTAVLGGTAAVVLPNGLQAHQASGGAPARIACSLTINTQHQQLEIDPRTTLLDLLRENLQLTGTKKGCDHGQCGACTVLVNGKRVNSCLTLALMHDGHEITTIEGLADGSQLHPMQAAFIENDGFQCGVLYSRPDLLGGGDVEGVAVRGRECRYGKPRPGRDGRTDR